ncbi:MAG TPA: ribosome small subunit-dependent GTPase A [Cyanothece sp. UBA12306]|nr:ribosome small subunit-dependent GTPase A [Cyanothece sp. UBA12306]
MSNHSSCDLTSEVIVSKILGTVVAVQANFYQVRLDKETKPQHGSEPSYLLCTRRTRLKKIGQQVMVGDLVLIEEVDYQDRRGAIAKVFPRQTELSRPPVANAEQILLVFALENPSLDPWQLSRFLVTAESTSLSLCLCFNKLDLITEIQRKQWEQRLENWGYNPLFISVINNQGLDNLKTCLTDKITIFAGPSGVGKSSLINTLIPQVEQRVGQVSGKLNKGRHTTRHVELFELPEGGLLADTPGFNQPNIECTPQELAFYFPEAKSQLNRGNCQFNDCLHRGEPNCIIQNDWERYKHYLSLLEEVINRQDALQKMGDEETNFKLKIKESGQECYEPKLETKRYRRRSRREKHQSLQGLYDHQSLEDFEQQSENLL